MRRLAGGLPALPLTAFVLLFALLPAALFVGTGVVNGGGVHGLGNVLADPLDRAAIVNSLVQGGLSAAAAVGIGYPLGLLLGRYEWPGRRIVRSLLLVPFLLPSLVVAFGVEELLGPSGLVGSALPIAQPLAHGLGGIVVANVYFNAPLVALLTAVGVETSSAELEETVATLGGGGFEVFRRTWGPASWRGAAAGGLLTFLYSALAFAAPLVLCGPGCYTLEARIWTLDQELIDPVSAGLLAGVMVAILLLPTLAYLYLIATRHPPSGTARTPRARPLRGWAAAGVVACGGTVLLILFGFLGSVLWSAGRAAAPRGAPGSALSMLFGPRITAAMGLPTSQALVNTVLFGVGAATIALLLGLSAGALVRRSLAYRSALSVLVFLPVLVSPIVLSISLATFWRPLLGGEGTVWLLIVLGQATIALPLGLQALSVGLSRLSRGPAEAAQVLGASPLSTYLDIDLPRVRASIAAAGLLAFAVGLGEFTATYFLAIPKFSTLPVELYRLDSIRQLAAASALTGILVVLSAALFVALGLAGERVEL